MEDQKNYLGLGVIGFGNFAMFAVQQFLQIPGVKLVAIAGTHREAADAAAKRFGAVHLKEVEDLLKHPDIDLVYIATPPFLHHRQVMDSLKANKNVICEKPLSLNMHQADEIMSLAKQKNLCMVVNLMQRYNPLYIAIKKLIDEKPLGEVIHCYFENYASDEDLGPNHWFWDREKSGGIFIEHGVHFFDMFEGWLGKGKVVSAQSIIRPGTNIEEQVNCTAIYNDVMVNFYHGFTQANRMDRQELRLLFEKGDVTLYEWIPTRMIINAITSESDAKIVAEIFPDAKIKVIDLYSGNYRNVGFRHKNESVYQMINVRYGDDLKKMTIYSDLVYNLFQDQVNWINNRSHKRLITEQNAYSSLDYAVQADNLLRNK